MTKLKLFPMKKRYGCFLAIICLSIFCVYVGCISKRTTFGGIFSPCGNYILIYYENHIVCKDLNTGKKIVKRVDDLYIPKYPFNSRGTHFLAQSGKDTLLLFELTSLQSKELVLPLKDFIINGFAWRDDLLHLDLRGTGSIFYDIVTNELYELRALKETTDRMTLEKVERPDGKHPYVTISANSDVIVVGHNFYTSQSECGLLSSDETFIQSSLAIKIKKILYVAEKTTRACIAYTKNEEAREEDKEPKTYIGVWDYSEDEIIYTVSSKMKLNPENTILLSPDGRYLYFSKRQNNEVLLYLVNLQDFSSQVIYREVMLYMLSLTVSPDGKRFSFRRKPFRISFQLDKFKIVDIPSP